MSSHFFTCQTCHALCGEEGHEEMCDAQPVAVELDRLKSLGLMWPPRQPKSVLKPWVGGLTLQMQGVLMTAIRGPDNEQKHSPSKQVVRALRAVILNNAKALGADDVFMGDGSGEASPEQVAAFFASWDQHPLHWLFHFLHAAEIVGYCHPNPKIRDSWLGFYRHAVNDLHLEPESKETMLKRLRSDGNAEASSGPCRICFSTDGVIPANHTANTRRRCANCLSTDVPVTPPRARTGPCGRCGANDCPPDYCKRIAADGSCGIQKA